ncbi:hypothetical protein [Niabella beijingensis]|uniref:hypothetical protein n=1 Tax=Niabella beijingensis TaxID=2872700 RepID=UPI001CC12969|nr:hypothetical protein [Niabella beijingensis]MBZ4191290.1 hypothetical protein [Niabella beijingensis]
MKKNLPIIALHGIILLAACNTGSAPAKTETAPQTTVAAKESTPVPFTVASHYFVKNDYTDGTLSNARISSQKDFDAIFGQAAVMGKDGSPTPVDFTKQYVIAVINPVSDSAVLLENPVLQADNGRIIFSYEEKKGAKQSFSTRPFLLLIVDNQYKGDVLTIKR